jgi:hypothetical protein
MFAIPMFRINKPLLIPKKYANDMVEYSMPCHGIFFHVENEYTKKYSITWHEIFSKILSCSCEHAHFLIH